MRRMFALACGLLVPVLPAWAQITYEPSTIKTAAEQSLMYEWICGTVFLLGCMVVAFKPSKRSNLR